MEISSILIGLLLVGFSSSDNVTTLDLNYEVILENAKGENFFKIPVYEGEEMSLVVKAYKPNCGNDIFSIYIRHFDHNPNGSEVMEPYNNWAEISGILYYNGEKYDYVMYQYPLNTSDSKYLGLLFKINTNQNITIGLYTKTKDHVYKISLFQEVVIMNCIEGNYFLIPYFSNNTMGVKTKVYHPYYTKLDDFIVTITGFSGTPNDSEIIYSKNWTRLIKYEFKNGSLYDNFSYPFETINNTDYFGFYFKCNFYDSASFSVYSFDNNKNIYIIAGVLGGVLIISIVIFSIIRCLTKSDIEKETKNLNKYNNLLQNM